MGYHVLLIEDNPAVKKINFQALSQAGYSIQTAGTIAEAKKYFLEHMPDLIVTDITLPDGSGLNLCQKWTLQTGIPFLFLTVLGDYIQIIEGLQAGGADYMTKPYYPEELVARADALLRHTDRILVGRPVLAGGIALDFRKQKAFYNNIDLQLKPKEFLILAILLHAPGCYYNMEELYREVWQEDGAQDIQTVAVHISTLRGRMKKAGITNIRILRDIDLGFCLVINEK